MALLTLSRRQWQMIVGGSIGALGLALFLRPSGTPASLPGGGRAPAPATAGPVWSTAGGPTKAEPAPPAFTTGLERLPTSLQGTQVPGTLAQDAQGNLVINHDLRQIFDYFLSIVGDESLASIHARIEAYVKAHVGSKAAAQALAILDQYGRYKQAEPDLAKFYTGDRIDQIQARFAALQNLRRESFAPDVVQAFFGEEEAWDQYSISKLAVMRDTSLSPLQKKAAVDQLTQQLPEDLRASATTAALVETLDNVEQDWKKRGGTPEELRAAREAVVGKDGADRLEALDRAKAEWNSRMTSYLQQRDQILADPTLADSTRQAQVEALRASLFTGPEAVRARALEGLHDAQAAAH